MTSIYIQSRNKLQEHWSMPYVRKWPHAMCYVTIDTLVSSGIWKRMHWTLRQFSKDLGQDLIMDLFNSSGRGDWRKKLGASGGLRELSEWAKRQRAFGVQFVYRAVHLYYNSYNERIPGHGNHYAADFELVVARGCWFIRKKFDVKWYYSALY